MFTEPSIGIRPIVECIERILSNSLDVIIVIVIVGWRACCTKCWKISVFSLACRHFTTTYSQTCVVHYPSAIVYSQLSVHLNIVCCSVAHTARMLATLFHDFIQSSFHCCFRSFERCLSSFRWCFRWSRCWWLCFVLHCLSFFCTRSSRLCTLGLLS